VASGVARPPRPVGQSRDPLLAHPSAPPADLAREEAAKRRDLLVRQALVCALSAYVSQSTGVSGRTE
jgi:hypothetical protein